MICLLRTSKTHLCPPPCWQCWAALTRMLGQCCLLTSQRNQELRKSGVCCRSNSKWTKTQVNIWINIKTSMCPEPRKSTCYAMGLSTADPWSWTIRSQLSMVMPYLQTKRHFTEQEPAQAWAGLLRLGQVETAERSMGFNVLYKLCFLWKKNFKFA